MRIARIAQIAVFPCWRGIHRFFGFVAQKAVDIRHPPWCRRPRWRSRAAFFQSATSCRWECPPSGGTDMRVMPAPALAGPSRNGRIFYGPPTGLHSVSTPCYQEKSYYKHVGPYGPPFGVNPLAIRESSKCQAKCRFLERKLLTFDIPHGAGILVGRSGYIFRSALICI